MTAEVLRPVFARTPVADVGDHRALLLAGPSEAEGAETLPGHLDRLGPLPWMAADEIVSTLEQADLRGRGGGGFPFARKLTTVRANASAALPPIVVVNVSESEPASHKDETLSTCRPHLILDGAAAAAAHAVGAPEVVLYLHAGSPHMWHALRAAVHERLARALDDPVWRLAQGPDRYVAGEATAVLAHVEGKPALPRWEAVPVAIRGVHGRPTLVSNAETFAHVAVILRFGADRWRAAGAGAGGGPILLTLQGAVREPGLVVEVVAPGTVGDVLLASGAVAEPPPAVLIGGYAGTWVPGDVAWTLPLDPQLRPPDAPSFGCGLLAVLPEGRCGLAETARVVHWLVGESAGQCGPCVFGLPRLRERFDAISRGELFTRPDALLRIAASIDGRGGCRHPDGVTRLIRSALVVFDEERRAHRRGKRCPAADDRLLPLPTGAGHGR